jgi:phosphate-selective porin OprO/OprP
MSHRDPVNDQVQVRIRNNIRNAPFPLLNLIANTGVIDADSQDLYNLETAAVYGPLTFQAEYTANAINGASVGTGPALGTVFFQGFYVEGLVFLTGESRGWDAKNFIFKRVIPRRNFLSVRDGSCEVDGPGAWEVGVRYSYLDLNDKGIAGGRLSSVTLGLTWYLNPNVKWQTNYDYLYRDRAANPAARGSVHALGTRLAFDF